jgi:hypothetical protein
MEKHEHSTDGRRNLAPSYSEADVDFLLSVIENISTAVSFRFPSGTVNMNKEAFVPAE